MNKTGFLYDEIFLEHITGSSHPEKPRRLLSIFNGIRESGTLAKLIQIKASVPDLKWIETVHSKKYIKRFENACSSGNSIFDSPDNRMCSKSYHVALSAVGGILITARMLMNGEIDNAFCAVRPPGHHAEMDKAMGFCYFNNIAIAARYLQIKHKIQKIGIVDFDVHHGNGTQLIFEKDPSVFYYSIHQDPSFAYPGTGRNFEQGVAEGFGFTKNSTVFPGKGDQEYRTLITKNLLPVFELFEPEVILVSAGFDAHIDDDMSDIRLSTKAFSWIMKEIYNIAEKYSKGRIISILEGGYSIKRLGELATNHIKILLNINDR